MRRQPAAREPRRPGSRAAREGPTARLLRRQELGEQQEQERGALVRRHSERNVALALPGRELEQLLLGDRERGAQHAGVAVARPGHDAAALVLGDESCTPLTVCLRAPDGASIVSPPRIVYAARAPLGLS